MIRPLACLGFAASLTACHVPAEATAPSSNPHVEVDTLFTHEGCTIFRFHDGGLAHYFVRCRDAPSASALATLPCGKNCARPEEIPTVAPLPAAR